MSTIYNDIRGALETTLSNVANVPTVYYENQRTPTNPGVEFIKCILLPGIRRPAVRGLNPQQYIQGIFEMRIHTDEGEGPGTAQTYASRLISAFESTTDITFNNKTLSIREVEQGAGTQDSPWYILPVRAYWYIYN